ncbi:hypothetical protein N7454_007362 [Penicillium verhagenii]|nr:hypothetical protein N7454_007362 [Penicillium verhagenii]
MSDHIGPFIVERWPDAQAMGAAYHCETLERVTLKSSNTSPDLSSEAKVLRSLSGGAGIPALHWFGKSHGQMMMITEMAGDPLEDIFNQGGRYFELQILLEFAHQLICRLEWIHSRSVSHGNLNPAILTLGASSWQAPQVTISNFGTAESSQFAPRKDLEDIGDIIIYFATAYTSWDSFKASKRHEQEVPSFLMAYFAIIRSQDLNLADYSTIRNHFDSARQLLNRTLFGGISDPEQQHLSLKNLSLKSTGDLFEDLGAITN